MSLGILSGKGQPVLRGLGSEPAPSSWCWGGAGYPWGAAFDTCHTKNWKTCDGQNYELRLSGKPQMTKTQFDDCVYVKDNMSCECPALAPTARPGSSSSAPAAARLTMGNKTSDPRVVELQTAINSVLTRNGYAAIGMDGKLGPGTCGAAREADKFGAGLMARYGLAGVCTSFTAPAQTGGGLTRPSGGGGGAPLAPPTTLSPTSSSGALGMDMPTLLLIGAVGAGLWVFFGSKKKGEKAAA